MQHLFFILKATMMFHIITGDILLMKDCTPDVFSCSTALFVSTGVATPTKVFGLRGMRSWHYTTQSHVLNNIIMR